MKLLQKIGTVKNFRYRKTKRVATQDGYGFTTVDDGFIIADLDVHVDIEALVAAIGRRAIKSKSGKSILQGGAVTVRVASKKLEQAA